MISAPTSSFRNQFRDPVEHALWSRYYPVIAKWEVRPYFKDSAIKLNLAAARQLYPAATPEGQVAQARQWRRAEARFMAIVEYRSAGAFSAKLLEHGDSEGAERIRGLCAVVQPILEAAQRREDHIRSGLKQLLAESGLSTQLSDERYEPSKDNESTGDGPVPFSVGQLSVHGAAKLRVVDLFTPRAPEDGIRILCDMYPTGLRSHHQHLYDLRTFDGLPSHGLFMWFKHDPARWEEFQNHHHRQLHGDHKSMLRLLKALSSGPATLLHLRRGEHSVARSLFNYLLTHYPDVFTAADQRT